MYPQRSPLPLRDYFAGLAEYAFQTRLGVADPPLIDYLAELLARFIRLDAISAMRGPRGNRVDELAAMVLEAQKRQGEACRESHRHVGDVALFWAGIYPESLRNSLRSTPHDPFVDCCTQGKRAYFIASTLVESDDNPRAQLLERLSHEFELCVYGLSEVRREWERKDPDSGEPSGPIILS